MPHLPLPRALAFGEVLFAGGQDILILLTGVGTRLLIATLATRRPRKGVVAALGRLTLVCRGPKSIAALKEVGLAPALAVPEPNTWRGLLSALDGQLPIGGKRVAVQEYGARNEELLAGLRERGAHVTTWKVLATQIDNVFHVARENGRRLDRTDHEHGASAPRRRARSAARTSQDRAPGGGDRSPGRRAAGAQAGPIYRVRKDHLGRPSILRGPVCRSWPVLAWHTDCPFSLGAQHPRR
jgi:hypothetical protein